MKDFDPDKELARYMLFMGLVILLVNLPIILAIIYVILDSK